ncbi:MAG: 2-C-methyl-D-erythritol 4-phosphate cytidylyltransferase, partial [Kiritimatiellae bacterium]|nr:2-C-methyl-D-erythritol 4-phosphate cytidylyltransferase [Kiritimatiellia bacterium]
ISEIAKAVKRSGAVTVGRKITDTVKRVEKGSLVSATEERDKLWAVQTPQAFQIKILRAAYKALGKKEVTDDCHAVELSGESVKILESRLPNFKITTVEDLQIAGALLK